MSHLPLSVCLSALSLLCVCFSCEVDETSASSCNPSELEQQEQDEITNARVSLLQSPHLSVLPPRVARKSISQHSPSLSEYLQASMPLGNISDSIRLLENKQQGFSKNGSSNIFSEFVSTISVPSVGCVAITGTTSGLGNMAVKAILQDIDNQSTTPIRCILLLNRYSSRSVETEAEFKSLSNDGKFIKTIECDLQNFESVRTAAESVGTVSKPYGGLSVLVLNAGTFDSSDSRTSDECEITMQTNHLSHFLLTKLLLPSLGAAAEKYGEARIVSHSSILRHGRELRKQYFLKSEPGTLGGEDGAMERYHQSKLANAAFAMALSRKLAQSTTHSRIKAVACAPGVSDTEIFESQSHGMPVQLQSVAQEVDDAVCPLLAAMFAEDTESGDFIEPEYMCGIYGWPKKVIEGGRAVRNPFCDTSGNHLACDESSQKMMWETTEESVGENFPIE